VTKIKYKLTRVIAEMVAACREIAECSHEVVVDFEGSPRRWCAHCGALDVGKGFIRHRIGAWLVSFAGSESSSVAQLCREPKEEPR
jgi:hypothetical protein